MGLFLENKALPILSINSEGICALIRQECSLSLQGALWVPLAHGRPVSLLCPGWKPLEGSVVCDVLSAWPRAWG